MVIVAVFVAKESDHVFDALVNAYFVFVAVLAVHVMTSFSFL